MFPPSPGSPPRPPLTSGTPVCLALGQGQTESACTSHGLGAALVTVVPPPFEVEGPSLDFRPQARPPPATPPALGHGGRTRTSACRWPRVLGALLLAVVTVKGPGPSRQEDTF